MTETWIAAIIRDENGEDDYCQFDSEDELRFYLSLHEECKLIKWSRVEK